MTVCSKAHVSAEKLVGIGGFQTYVIWCLIDARTLQNPQWKDIGELVERLVFPVQAEDGLLKSLAAAGERDYS